MEPGYKVAWRSLANPSWGTDQHWHIVLSRPSKVVRSVGAPAAAAAAGLPPPRLGVANPPPPRDHHSQPREVVQLLLAAPAPLVLGEPAPLRLAGDFPRRDLPYSNDDADEHLG